MCRSFVKNMKSAYDDDIFIISSNINFCFSHVDQSHQINNQKNQKSPYIFDIPSDVTRQ